MPSLYPTAAETEAFLRKGKSDGKALRKLKAWKKSMWKPRMTEAEKRDAIEDLHVRLFDGAVRLKWGKGNFFSHRADRITMDGASIITYLHEAAHSMGMDEFGAVAWSVTLFRDAFPKALSKLRLEGHALVRVKDEKDKNEAKKSVKGRRKEVPNE